MAFEPASGLQIKFPEFLCRRAELAKLINGRASRRKGEGLERFGEQLVEVGSGCETGGDMRTEVLGGILRNKRRDIVDQEGVDDAIIRSRDEGGRGCARHREGRYR